MARVPFIEVFLVVAILGTVGAISFKGCQEERECRRKGGVMFSGTYERVCLDVGRRIRL